MIERLDELSSQIIRSRNELIDLLLDADMKIVKEEEERRKCQKYLGISACFLY